MYLARRSSDDCPDFDAPSDTFFVMRKILQPFS